MSKRPGRSLRAPVSNKTNPHEVMFKALDARWFSSVLYACNVTAPTDRRPIECAMAPASLPVMSYEKLVRAKRSLDREDRDPEFTPAPNVGTCSPAL